MTRRAESPDAFQIVNYAFEDLLKEEPVDNDALFEGLENLETAGIKAFDEGYRKLYYIAYHIHRRLVTVPTVEVEPPLSTEQKTELGKKLGKWATIAESTKPAPRPRQPRATPTEAIQTDAVKQ